MKVVLLLNLIEDGAFSPLTVFFSSSHRPSPFDMPNLTSYRAPPTHVRRELPKRFCDLIRHELDYAAFLRTRIANVHRHHGHSIGGIDCHNENYKQKTNISHFRRRQRQWQEKVDRENERFHRSLV